MNTSIVRIGSIAVVAWTLLQDGKAHAIQWKANASGNFSTGTNWVGNVAPTSSDTATFGVGTAANYTVTLNGAAPGFPAVVHTVDRLIVGSNTVSLARNSLLGATSLVVNNATPNQSPGIVVGELATDKATLNTSIPITDVIATIADAAGSVGTWNVNAGSLSLTGVFSLNVGSHGMGTLNISGGATVNLTNAEPLAQIASMGLSSGSSGTMTVSGTGSQFTGFDLRVGENGMGTLNIINGGKVSGFSGIMSLGDSGTGIATVDGLGSLWELSGGMTVGLFGNSMLSITHGGVVTNIQGGDIGSGNNAGGSYRRWNGFHLEHWRVVDRRIRARYADDLKRRAGRNRRRRRCRFVCQRSWSRQGRRS